jgi:alkanesulfonate monooxygenase SsuD/methylene tetrahydromethanopterin reductase-like flavin-dependent oxidoreductase (luciferase family)
LALVHPRRLEGPDEPNEALWKHNLALGPEAECFGYRSALVAQRTIDHAPNDPDVFGAFAGAGDSDRYDNGYPAPFCGYQAPSVSSGRAGDNGAADQVAEHIRRFRDAGIELFVLQFQAFEAETRHFATEVGPRVRPL